MDTERLNKLSTNGLSWVRNDWYPPEVVGEFLWVVGELALACDVGKLAQVVSERA